MKWMAVLVCLGAPLAAQVQVGPNEIGGVVNSVRTPRNGAMLSRGPEAGVWVIAETTDLPTKYAKIVVTDERGRYLIPDLPKANYRIWVRGYGLVDSPKVEAAPGNPLNLTAVPAPDERAAAGYYPASYWYALLRPPAQSEFPGTGPEGNGINPNVHSQEQFIELIKTDSCYSCHALGTKATREIPAGLGSFDSPVKAWMRRIQSGQAGRDMVGGITRLGADRALAMFADWTSRIAAGELPAVKPSRPQGIERNLVITEWDWTTPNAYLHDEIASDKRNPRVNAKGLLYGAPELSTDWIPVLDPVRNVATKIKMPVRDPQTARPGPPMQASVYWSNQAIWDSQANMHNPMFDEKGRVWFTSVIRPPENPSYCKDGSIPSSKLFPLNRSGRQLAFYDPPSRHFTLIDTCFGTHHLQFAEDANHTLWTSSGGGGDVVGWLDTKMYERTHDEEKSQGWTALILDTNGNGKRDAYVEPDQPVDPKKDKRISGAFYGVTVSPADGSIWGTILGFPGRVVRLNPGSHPPETALAEVYELPAPEGFSPRGLDIDTNGVVWTVLSSGHFASFDRRKCKGPLNGPNATGRQCREGWSLYPFPVPQFKGVTAPGSVEASYYDWVDQHDTLGLGRNIPIATGNGEDALLALVNGKWVTLRVPYPIGFYAKGMDGRIDDPNTGWKGKGIWSTYATRAMAHVEGGKGTTSKVLHFQMRPGPLAR